MTEYCEKWSNVSGDVWEVHHDDKTGLVTYVQHEEVFVDPPPAPWSYDYVTTVLQANGYSLVPGSRVDKWLPAE